MLAFGQRHLSVRTLSKMALLTERREGYNDFETPMMTESPIHSPQKKLRTEPLFYMVVLVVLVSVYGWAVYASAAMRTPAGFWGFTGLMALHAGLHLVIPRLTQRTRWLPSYFLLQAVLVWLITAITRTTGTGHGQYLYLVMAVEVIALFSGVSARVMILVVAYLLLGFIHFVGLWGWQAVPEFLGQALPQTFFAIAFTILFFRQLNARRHTQVLLQQLEAAHQQLSEYAAQIEDLTLATERQRLARELHDTLAQGVAGLTMQLEAVDKHLARGNGARAQTIVQQAMQQARKTLMASRAAINDLRNTGEPQASFAEQVRAEIEQFHNKTGLACALNPDVPEALPQTVQRHVLCMVAEGLLNIAHHAQASQVSVSIKSEGGALDVVIHDNGIGFEPSQPIGAGHYGLMGLRERAHLLGGTLHVEGGIGWGTTLRLHVSASALAHKEPVGVA